MVFDYSGIRKWRIAEEEWAALRLQNEMIKSLITYAMVEPAKLEDA